MSDPTIIPVANELELNRAIATVDGATSGSFVIQFTADITEGTDTGGAITFDGKTIAAPPDLYALNLQSGVSLTIDGTTAKGGSYSLSGAGHYRGFFAYSGAVTIQNLAIKNTAAVGGNGGEAVLGGTHFGRDSGGGGGAGLGGGLYVGANAQVTLSGVTFSSDRAQGGNGGGYVTNGHYYANGGGGGLGGNGHRGGGGIGAGAQGLGYFNSYFYSAGSGVVLGALTNSNPGGAPYGGGGGRGPVNSGYNGGGIGSTPAIYFYTGSNGGVGGGGGAGHATRASSVLYSRGGNGGFGGGGGGGDYGGNGGFGGGGGGGRYSTAFGESLAGYGGFGAGDGGKYVGGGGLGAGGAIFVQQGGALVVGAGGISGGSVHGGANGGANGPGYTPANSAFGSGIFVRGNNTLTFAPGAGQTLNIADVIADLNGSGGTGVNAGSAAVLMDGKGTVVLDAVNTFTGGITIASGTVELAVAGAAGTGAITFANDPSLVIDGTTMPTNDIDGFVPGDTIDLASIADVAPSRADMNYTTNVLTITTGGSTYLLNFDPTANFSGDYFHLAPDSSTKGTLITEDTTPCYCRGTMIRTARAEVAVETLVIGDEVMTASGVARPIKWIGRRSYAGRFVMGRNDILPVCIKAGALAENVPQRDLWISPHHGMYFEDKRGGVLIEAKDLVNGTSIVQAERVDKIEYFHIELDKHDIIVAEGALSETYLDEDNRCMFHNAPEYDTLYAEEIQEVACYCAPRLEDGYAVEDVRRRIALRAARSARIKVYRRVASS